MGKFNKEMINGAGKGIQVGGGLLSTESQKLGRERDENVFLLDVEDIEPNPKNRMSQSNIEEMAELIKLAGGIEENLTGYALENGKVRLTAGHRRYRGAKLLKERDNIIFKIPCKIKDFRSLELPLDEENKELFAIHVTNKYREKTDADRMIEIQDWGQIIRQLRERGQDVLVLNDESTGEAQIQQISGVKTREIIAQQTGIKPAQVGRFEKMLNSGNIDLVNAVLEEKLDLSGAEEVARLPKTKQKAFVNTDSPQVMTGRDVKKELRKVQDAESIPVSIESFRADTKEIESLLLNAPIEFPGSEYKKYQDCINRLKKIMKV